VRLCIDEARYDLEVCIRCAGCETVFKGFDAAVREILTW
jgi:hypothetical protein